MIEIQLAGPGIEPRDPALDPSGRTAAGSPGRAPYQGTKFELCSIIVVTTLSPSRNSVSSEYITALIASVVLR